jgi:hypothetical protein
MPTLMPLSSTMCSQFELDGYQLSCTLTGVTWLTFTSCGATEAAVHTGACARTPAHKNYHCQQ